jgi:hypothetical protein
MTSWHHSISYAHVKRDLPGALHRADEALAGIEAERDGALSGSVSRFLLWHLRGSSPVPVDENHGMVAGSGRFWRSKPHCTAGSSRCLERGWRTGGPGSLDSCATLANDAETMSPSGACEPSFYALPQVCRMRTCHAVPTMVSRSESRGSNPIRSCAREA